MTSKESTTAVILAGGQARRMQGEDKGLIELNGRPMIAYILDIVRPQAHDVLINANRNHERYAGFGHRVISDELSGFQGPLAGMASAMQAAATPFVACVPCDGPLLPPDLMTRLHTVRGDEDADIAVAHDGNRMQPVFALLKCDLLPSLQAFLQAGERKIDHWYAQHRVALADFSNEPDIFLNINTPAQCAALAARLGGRRAD
ncbi:MAG: molybdenum cofactor guanylyltransferase MobA [Gammaproteobacteria bacterium]